MTDPPVDLLALVPFAQTLGVEVLAAGPDEVRARLFWRERLCTAGGVLHGGVLMALGDSTGALCAYLNLPEGASTSPKARPPPPSSRRPTSSEPSPTATSTLSPGPSSEDGGSSWSRPT